MTKISNESGTKEMIKQDMDEWTGQRKRRRWMSVKTKKIKTCKINIENVKLWKQKCIR